MDRRERRLRRRWGVIQPVLFYGQILGLYYMLVKECLEIHRRHQVFEKLHWIVLATVSLTLWSLARIQLGSNLTFFAQPGRRLVTSGLYARFRHPIYYFGTTGIVSYCCLTDQQYLLWILVVLIPAQIIRALRERVVLKAKFDDEYLEYERRVWI